MSKKKKHEEHFPSSVGAFDEPPHIPEDSLLEESKIQVNEDGSLSGSGITAEGQDIDWKLIPRAQPKNPNIPGTRIIEYGDLMFHRDENGNVSINGVLIDSKKWVEIIATLSWRDIGCIDKATGFHMGPNKG